MGFKTGGSGQVKFYPYNKGGGGRKSVSHAEGGHKTFWIGLIREFEVLATLMGGAKSFNPLKGRRKRLYPLVKGGGGAKVLDPQFSHFVAPPPPPLL